MFLVSNSLYNYQSLVQPHPHKSFKLIKRTLIIVISLVYRSAMLSASMFVVLNILKSPVDPFLCFSLWTTPLVLRYVLPLDCCSSFSFHCADVASVAADVAVVTAEVTLKL